MLSGCFLFKECHLNDFEHSMVVGARQPGQTMALLGFTHTTTSRIYREFFGRKKENIQ